MEFDGTQIEDTGEFPVPGDHPCVCTKDEDKFTQGGFPCVNITWKILDGPSKGLFLYDKLVLKGRDEDATKYCQQRVKMVCKRVGIDVTKKFTVAEGTFVGKYAIVVLEKGKDYEDETGTKKTGIPKIPFNGYKVYEGPTVGATAPTTERQPGQDEDDFFKK